MDFTSDYYSTNFSNHDSRYGHKQFGQNVNQSGHENKSHHFGRDQYPYYYSKKKKSGNRYYQNPGKIRPGKAFSDFQQPYRYSRSSNGNSLDQEKKYFNNNSSNRGRISGPSFKDNYKECNRKSNNLQNNVLNEKTAPSYGSRKNSCVNTSQKAPYRRKNDDAKANFEDEQPLGTIDKTLSTTAKNPQNVETLEDVRQNKIAEASKQLKKRLEKLNVKSKSKLLKKLLSNTDNQDALPDVNGSKKTLNDLDLSVDDWKVIGSGGMVIPRDGEAADISDENKEKSSVANHEFVRLVDSSVEEQSDGEMNALPGRAFNQEMQTCSQSHSEDDEKRKEFSNDLADCCSYSEASSSSFQKVPPIISESELKHLKDMIKKPNSKIENLLFKKMVNNYKQFLAKKTAKLRFSSKHCDSLMTSPMTTIDANILPADILKQLSCLLSSNDAEGINISDTEMDTYTGELCSGVAEETGPNESLKRQSEPMFDEDPKAGVPSIRIRKDLFTSSRLYDIIPECGTCSIGDTEIEEDQSTGVESNQTFHDVASNFCISPSDTVPNVVPNCKETENCPESSSISSTNQVHHKPSGAILKERDISRSNKCDIDCSEIQILPKEIRKKSGIPRNVSDKTKLMNLILKESGIMHSVDIVQIEISKLFETQKLLLEEAKKIRNEIIALNGEAVVGKNNKSLSKQSQSYSSLDRSNPPSISLNSPTSVETNNSLVTSVETNNSLVTSVETNNSSAISLNTPASVSCRRSVMRSSSVATPFFPTSASISRSSEGKNFIHPDSSTPLVSKCKSLHVCSEPVSNIQVTSDGILACTFSNNIVLSSLCKFNIQAARTYSHQGPITALTIFDSNMVVSGSADGTLYFFRNMERMWTIQVDGKIDSIQADGDIGVYVMLNTGHIYHYNYKRKKLETICTNDVESDRNFYLRLTQEGARQVLLVGCKDNIIVRDARTGLYLRSISHTNNHISWLCAMGSWVFVGHKIIRGYNFVTGTEEFEFGINSPVQAATSNKSVLYIVSNDGYIHTILVKSKKIVPMRVSSCQLTSVATWQNKVLVGDKEGNVHVLEKSDEGG